MVDCNSRLKIFLFFVCILSYGQILGQENGGFDYEPSFEEATINPLKMDHAGFGFFIFSDLEQEYLGENYDQMPLGLEGYYEFSRLIFRNSDDINISANIAGQIVFPILWGIRVPLGADLRLGNLARKESEVGSRGMLIGGGYEQLYLTRGFSQGSGFSRVGFAVENFMLIYQYNFDSPNFEHNLTFGMKLDW